MFSFHTHSFYCDGKASMTDFCNRAVEVGLTHLGFTSHAPVPFSNEWSISFEKLLAYKSEFQRLMHQFEGKLELFLGFEADFVYDESIRFAEWWRLLNADFMVGSVHLVMEPGMHDKWFIDGPSEQYHEGLKRVFAGDIKRAVRAYYRQIREMVATERFDVVGHLDKIKMNNQNTYFTTDESWYLDEVEQTLLTIKNANRIVEINSRGIYKGKYPECFPSIPVIERCVELEIPITLASDSHHPDELKIGFEVAKEIALQSGVKSVMVLQNSGWKCVDIKTV
jgi:histidinol-phosphatase (PHP family)